MSLTSSPYENISELNVGCTLPAAASAWIGVAAISIAAKIDGLNMMSSGFIVLLPLTQNRYWLNYNVFCCCDYIAD